MTDVGIAKMQHRAQAELYQRWLTARRAQWMLWLQYALTRMHTHRGQFPEWTHVRLYQGPTQTKWGEQWWQQTGP